MTSKEKAATEAEELVRKVLVEHFKQNVDPETLHDVAKKVSQTVPAHWEAARAT